MTTTARINTKITEATSQKPSRYANTGVLISATTDPDRLCLQATDGRIAALSFVAGSTDESPIQAPIEAFPTTGLRKSPTISHNGSGRWESSGGKFAPELTEPATFPPISNILPDSAEVDDYQHVSIDIKLLKRLADAISETGIVTLLIPPPKPTGQTTTAVVVLATTTKDDEQSDNFGLIMPVATKISHSYHYRRALLK